MALGELTKQLAQQAIGNALSSSEPAKPDNPGALIIAQVQAMQKALKEDDELIVLFHSGGETIRVHEIIVPAWSVAVLSGADANRTLTRIISHMDALQLVCKIMKAPPGAKPARLNFILPKNS